jgi:hypothetical protein
MTTLEDLMKSGPTAVSLGLREFAESLRFQGRQVIHVDWSPPPMDEEMKDLLDKLL